MASWCWVLRSGRKRTKLVGGEHGSVHANCVAGGSRVLHDGRRAERVAGPTTRFLLRGVARPIVSWRRLWVSGIRSPEPKTSQYRKTSQYWRCYQDRVLPLVFLLLPTQTSRSALRILPVPRRRRLLSDRFRTLLRLLTPIAHAARAREHTRFALSSSPRCRRGLLGQACGNRRRCC